MSLAGKDFFTEEEAAHYACVSQSQFRAKRAEYSLQAFRWMGKVVYRRADIQRAMEEAWQRSPTGLATTSSHGRTRRRASAAASPSARSAPSPTGFEPVLPP